MFSTDWTVGDGGVLERSNLAVESCGLDLSKLVASRRTWCCKVLRT